MMVIVLPFKVWWVDWAQVRILPLYVTLAKILGTGDSAGLEC